MTANTGFDIRSARTHAVADFVDSSNKGENGIARIAFTVFYAWTQGVGNERFPFDPVGLVTPGSDQIAERMERAMVWFGVKVPKQNDGTKYEWDSKYSDAFRRAFPMAVKRATMIAAACIKAKDDGHGTPELRKTVLIIPACVLAGSDNEDKLAKAVGKGTEADDQIKLNGRSGASLNKAMAGARAYLGFASKGSADKSTKRPASASEAATIAAQLANYMRAMSGNKPSGDLRNELLAIDSLLDEIFTEKDVENYRKEFGDAEAA